MKKLYWLVVLVLFAGLHLQASETNLVIVPISRSPRPGEILQASFISPPGKRIIAIGYVWVPVEEKKNYGSGGGLANVELIQPAKPTDEKALLRTPTLELRVNPEDTVATFHGGRGLTLSLFKKTK